MKVIVAFIVAALVGGTALAAVATLSGWSARSVDQQPVRSLRQGSQPMSPRGVFRGARGHTGGGLGGGK
jgi:hypothetical protein